MPLINDLLNGLGRLAPPDLAFDWDNPGLQVGDLQAEVVKVALALDPTLEAVAEALDLGCQALLTHHPLIFKPLKKVDRSQPQGKIIAEALKHNLALIAAHTNWDAAQGGVAWALAESLGLVNCRFLEERGRDIFLKLTVFTPEGHEEEVKNALFQAGAGAVGNYDQCSFSLPGWGEFRPLAGAEPYVGEVGSRAKVREVRLEMVVPASKKNAVLKALRASHPYEEPAFDLCSTEVWKPRGGLGILGELKTPVPWKNFRRTLQTFSPNLKVAVKQNEDFSLNKIALMPGSGGGYFDLALKAGAQLLISGDISHHQALDALEAGLMVADMGHFESEWPGVVKLAHDLIAWNQLMGLDFEFVLLTKQTSPWSTWK